MRRSRAHTCRACAELLVDYVKGELSPSRCRSIERHLTNCTGCAKFQSELRREIAACRAHGGPSMPAAARRRARQRVRQIIGGALRRQ